jgi:hypothetical protein
MLELKHKNATDHCKLSSCKFISFIYHPLPSNHLPLTAVGSNPDRDFGFFHVKKLSR